jgi:hypothetical protein
MQGSTAGRARTETGQFGQQLDQPLDFGTSGAFHKG